MEDNRSVFRSSLAIAVAIIVLGLAVAWGLAHIREDAGSIVVTGSAKKRITSDLIVWKVTVNASSGQLSEAYRILSTNGPRVRQYLISKGIAENQIEALAIHTQVQREGQPVYDEARGRAEAQGRVLGYSLQQQFRVRSTEVEKVMQISRQVTELINEGILLESAAPEYLYTKLGDLKIAIMADAARDAKARAVQIAGSTGATLGDVRAARMGVLQITPADSVQVSDYGMNDTTALEKDVTAVVNVTFALK
ncbi:MAG TPA: SIMPL domain-containing protein [Terriglobales bacterium]|nr:SIMPL domain-containing protein [Terriglobales bacterium]